MGKPRRPRDPLYEARTGRSASPEAVALRRWIHQRYLEDSFESLPGRFRYYEAISDQVISKTAAQEIDEVIEGEEGESVAVTKGDRLWKAALMWVREHLDEMGEPLVPDSWVTDTTRSITNYTGWKSFNERVLAAIKYARLDIWDNNPPVLIVESESSASAVNSTVNTYRMIAAPLRGQGGRSFLANDVAPLLLEDTVVLSIGDLDKAGSDIMGSAQRRLEEFCGFPLDWRHIALTDEQVDEYDIVRVPRVDKREKVREVRMVAETEALGATRMRTILSEILDDLLPEPLVSVQERERVLRAEYIAEHGLTDEDDDEDEDD